MTNEEPSLVFNELRGVSPGRLGSKYDADTSADPSELNSQSLPPPRPAPARSTSWSNRNSRSDAMKRAQVPNYDSSRKAILGADESREVTIINWNSSYRTAPARSLSNTSISQSKQQQQRNERVPAMSKVRA